MNSSAVHTMAHPEWNRPDLRRLFLRGLTLDVSIGVHAFELAKPQRVVFDIDVFVSRAATSPSSDALSEVVDYDFVRDIVHERVARGHINLQETLCDDVLAAILAHPQVSAARVSSRKPDVYPDCEAVGVEVFRTKEQASP